MTDPREQAIEEAAKALAKHDGHHLDGFASLKNMMYRGYARRAIDTYEKYRARLDGAKMMPREADMNMLIAGLDALVTEIKRQNGPRPQVDDGQVLTDDEAAQRYMALGSEVRSSHEVAEAYRAMHDATPKEMD